MNRSMLIAQFFQFLRQELLLPEESLNLIKKHSNYPECNLPMLLWQYGLISLAELDSIFDWLEQKSLLI